MKNLLNMFCDFHGLQKQLVQPFFRLNTHLKDEEIMEGQEVLE
jgi:hypothetical protein